MKQAPTRYNHQKVHNDFGIKNWFAKKGLYDENEIRQIKRDFCTENGFNLIAETPSKKKHENQAINSFIQNRFPAFCQFASKTLRQCEAAIKLKALNP